MIVSTRIGLAQARVLNRILTEDFGFEHLLFVYSVRLVCLALHPLQLHIPASSHLFPPWQGRRGLHCWGCDTRARVMSNDVRSAVADYLAPKLNAATGRLAISQPMHPSLRRAHDGGAAQVARCGGRLRSASDEIPTLIARDPPVRPPALHAGARRYTEDLEPFFLESILASEPEGFGELDREAGQASFRPRVCGRCPPHIIVPSFALRL